MTRTPDPEGHSAAEDLDEDRLRLDPLEAGMDPPEHWSPAMEHRMTEREEREGRPLDERLREEQPDTVAPREPRDEVERMAVDGELDGRPADDLASSAAESRRGPTEDESSVARELRTPRTPSG